MKIQSLLLVLLLITPKIYGADIHNNKQTRGQKHALEALTAIPGALAGCAAYHLTPHIKIQQWAENNNHTWIAWLAQHKIINVAADAAAVFATQYMIAKTEGQSIGFPNTTGSIGITIFSNGATQTAGSLLIKSQLLNAVLKSSHSSRRHPLVSELDEYGNPIHWESLVNENSNHYPKQ